MAFGYYGKSGFVLNSSFHSAEWSGTAQSKEAYDKEWHEHFFSIMKDRPKRGDVPLPCIIKSIKKTALRGGLKPRGEEYSHAGSEWVFLSNGKYMLCDMDDIREPTDKEYNRYFKKMYEKTCPQITAREKTKKVRGGQTILIPPSERFVEVRFPTEREKDA